MSFILDAIKKSEDRRNQNKQQDVHSLQAQLRTKTPRRGARRRWFEFLCALILLSVAGWFFIPMLTQEIELKRFFANLHSPTSPKTTVGSTIKNQSEAVLNTDRSNNKSSDRYNNIDDTFLASANDPLQRYEMNDDLPPRHQIKELWELPADFQEHVPKMAFSFHFYSNKPGKSSVDINDRLLREGKMIASQTKLRLITTSGIIVFHRGRFFHIDVVEKLQ